MQIGGELVEASSGKLLDTLDPHGLPRRDFLLRAGALGVSRSVPSNVLAACGPSGSGTASTRNPGELLAWLTNKLPFTREQ